jgi:hypothetical protein
LAVSTLCTPLRVLRPADIRPQEEGLRWLIENLWPCSAVGIIGGQPKSWKSWLALDLAISVSSASPCLGRFDVAHQGPALIFLAEDALPDVRHRLECLCQSRGLQMDRLDLHVIAEPVLRLDQNVDRQRLLETVTRLQPRLLVLDPLVRLHRIDENNSMEVAELLGYLRELERSFGLAIALVHHTSKRAHARHGQALRGSSDLHAWTDVGLYLTWHGDRLRLTHELRMAGACQPVELRLVTTQPAAIHLSIDDPSPTSTTGAGPTLHLTQRLLHLLECKAPQALRRQALREDLRVNNAKLGEALLELTRLGLIDRTEAGWKLVNRKQVLQRSVSDDLWARTERNAERMPGETDSGSAGMQPGKG